MVKSRFIFIIIFIFAGSGFLLFAQTLSGNLDTRITLGAGAGNSPDFFYGAEESANLRLKIKAGEYAAIYSAFNLIAAAGTHGALLLAAGSMAGINSIGENYAALMELERLYVQFSAESFGLSAGLLRIPFGYSLVWAPMDFLNPHNPLDPDARLRGALGIIANLYTDKFGDSKFSAFAAAPKDPTALSGEGSRVGLSWDSHWQRASMQLLYCFETPASYTAINIFDPAQIQQNEYPQGLHRMGLSFKAEIKFGLTAEFLYTLNTASPGGINGLAASAGADYSFFDGKLYFLAEYLYSGSESVSAKSAALPAGKNRSHYLYSAGIWRWSDFAMLTLGSAAGLEDMSFTPFISWQYEFIQGMVLTLRSLIPLDKTSFNLGEEGELGPKNSGSYVFLTIGLRIKF